MSGVRVAPPHLGQSLIKSGSRVVDRRRRTFYTLFVMSRDRVKSSDSRLSHSFIHHNHFKVNHAKHQIHKKNFIQKNNKNNHDKQLRNYTVNMCETFMYIKLT